MTAAGGGRRVLVAGAGAVGLWLAARLSVGGHEVAALCRGRHAEAVAREGLVVRGRTEFRGPVVCVTDAADLEGGFDAVFVTCKAYDTAVVGEAVAGCLARGGVLASLQNGLGNAQKLAARVGPERVAVCLTSHGVTVEGPGRVFHAGLGATRVGPCPGSGEDAAARAALGLLADAGLVPSWCQESRGAVWYKAIVNHGINPLAALHGLGNGELLADGGLMERSRALVEEAYALSRAAGVRLLPDGDVVEAVRGTLAATAENRCSMLQDVAAGRATEVEQITGAFVRVGRRLGFPMPESDRVYREVKALEASYLGEVEALRRARAEAEAFPGDL